jgi:hypothetical protein
MPVLAMLENEGMDVVCLTARNVPSLGDGNSACFEAGLSVLGIEFRHLYEYRTASDSELLETSIDTVERLFDAVNDEAILDLFSKIDRGWFSASIIDFLECDRLMANAIEQERPDIVLGLHEANFWVKLMCRRAAMYGIPALSFQEGHYDSNESDSAKYRVMAEFSAVAIWGESAKEAILAQAPQVSRKLHLIGDLGIESLLTLDVSDALARQLAARRRLELESELPLVLLLLPNPYIKYADAIPLRKISDYIAGLEIKGKRVMFVAKWHPRESFALIRSFQDLENSGQMRSLVNGLARDWLEACDLALVLDSSAGLDALVLGKPLIEVNFSQTRFGRSYAEAGVTDLIASEEDLTRIQALLLGNSRGWTEKSRIIYLNRIYAGVNGEATKRLRNLVCKLVDSNNSYSQQ